MLFLLKINTYIDKIIHILNDDKKCSEVNREITGKLKADVNKFIEILNYVNILQKHKLNKTTGEYKPGYIYGNVKFHQPNNPFRPIIYQILVTTYQLAKSLNKLNSQYIPN